MKDFQPDFHRRLLLIYFFISAEVHVLVVAGTWLPARLDSGFLVCESICYHTVYFRFPADSTANHPEAVFSDDDDDDDDDDDNE